MRRAAEPKGKHPASARDHQSRARAKTNSAAFWPRWRGWNTPTAWISPPWSREAASGISRDTTVVAVLGTVTPEIAAALGDMARRGLLVTAIVVSLDMEAVPDWARPPDWAEMLLAQGIDFRVVNSEESISNLCAEAIVR